MRKQIDTVKLILLKIVMVDGCMTFKKYEGLLLYTYRFLFKMYCLYSQIPQPFDYILFNIIM